MPSKSVSPKKLYTEWITFPGESHGTGGCPKKAGTEAGGPEAGPEGENAAAEALEEAGAEGEVPVDMDV